MVGSSEQRDPSRLSGSRAEFVASLGRRLDALRGSLRSLEAAPADVGRQNQLLRRMHALGSSAKVLGFASVAEALVSAERGLSERAESALTKSALGEIGRSLDLLPSLVWGAPAAPRVSSEPVPASDATWPICVLVFGSEALGRPFVDAEGYSQFELEHTSDIERARERLRVVGPDVIVVDGDDPDGEALLEALAGETRAEPAPVVVVGEFVSAEAASRFVALGAQRVLPKPVGPETLRQTARQVAEHPPLRFAADGPVGEMTLEGLAQRIAREAERALIEAAPPETRETSIDFGEGADVKAAVWGALARLRELVTVRSRGNISFDPMGPEGAVPIAPWLGRDRAAGERGLRSPRGNQDATLTGRRVVVADDDPAVAWFLSGLLKAVGAEVVEAYDGKRALSRAFELWPDLVISDVLMPSLDGFALCRAIKQDVAIRDVPVILLSWKEDLLQRIRDLGADADGYLRKEAAASTVVQRIREVLLPRARVEERIIRDPEVRGRLDGLTPRLVLELCCAHRQNARLTVRDATHVYELDVRQGALQSARRLRHDGRTVEGVQALTALLGVSAGRFTLKSDASPCARQFDAGLKELLAEPIERARGLLRRVTGDQLIRVDRVGFDTAEVQEYLDATPAPLAELVRRLLAGVSPHDLIVSGKFAPELVETVLADLARRGAVRAVASRPEPLPSPAPQDELPPPSVRESFAPDSYQPVESAPVPLVALSRPAPELSRDDSSSETPATPAAFSFQLTPGAPPMDEVGEDWSVLEAGAVPSAATVPAAPIEERPSDAAWLRSAEEAEAPPAVSKVTPDAAVRDESEARPALDATPLAPAPSPPAVKPVVFAPPSAAPPPAAVAAPDSAPAPGPPTSPAPGPPTSPARAPGAPAGAVDGLLAWARTVAVALAAAAVSFVAVRWFVLPQFGAQRPAPAERAADAPPVDVPAPPAATEPPKETRTVAPRDLALPEGIALDDAGLVEVLTPGGTLVYVDGNFVGAGPLRRVPVNPGKHDVRVGQGASAHTRSVDVRAGRRVQLDLRTSSDDASGQQ